MLTQPSLNRSFTIRHAISLPLCTHVQECHGLSSAFLHSFLIPGYPWTSQSTGVYPNNPMPRASYCVPRCPRTFWDILTRGLKSQLGHRGISPDIPVNCCISKHSQVQHILLCPRMSRDILGLPNKRYAVPARTSRDIQGHPSQLVYIQTIPHPAHPIVSHTIPGHPNKRYAVPARTFRDIPGHPSQLVYIQTIPCQGHRIVSQDVLGHPGTS